MDGERRVVITGLGAVTPLGLSVKETWGNLIAGRSGISIITHFDPSPLDVKIAGEVKDFNPADYVGRKELKRMPRFVHLAVAATRMALEDARFDPTKDDPFQMGVVIGSACGGWSVIEENTQKLLANGSRAINSAMSINSIINMAPCHVGILFGMKGLALAPVSACGTGTHAIGEAYEWVRRGQIDVAVAGAAEAPISPLMLATLHGIGAASTANDEPAKACKPFDRRRDGMVIGEGAGIMILESLEHAIRRDTLILAEIVGFGLSHDGYHNFAPDPEGIGQAKAMEKALKQAGIRPSDIDWIDAHGTGTQRNDAAETAAIKRIFGEYAYKLPISAEKSMLGHPFAASGAIATIHTVKAIQEGIIPPTMNLDCPDPACDLDYVPNQARRYKVDTALVEAFGLGGQNACLIIQRFEP